MKFSPFLYLLAIVLFISCNTAEKEIKTVNTDTDHAVDAAAIKKAVDEAYAVISFKPGQSVNFDGIKKPFMPNAQLYNFRGDSLEILGINQFVDLYKAMVTTGGISSFYEEEIKGTTDQFGRIAQRISTYKTYINTMDTVAERGVNSFQLVKTAAGWKVSSIIWDVESAALKIPDYYLSSDTLK